MFESQYKKRGRHATWLELFFDLVFVAVIGVVTHDLAHTHNGHIGAEQLARFPLVFIPVWWIWMTHTLFANRFDKDDREHRVFTLFIMGILVVLSTYAETSLGENFSQFIFLYAIVRLMLGYRYWMIHAKHPEELAYSKDIAIAITIGSVVSLSALFLDSPYKYIAFYSGIVIDVTWQILLRNKLQAHPIDRNHLVERIGLLAIILLGESVIAMVASLSTEYWDLYDLLAASTGFFLIGAIWWIYFDSFPILERAERLVTGNILIFTHLLVCMGLLILANMIRHAILGDLDHETFSLLAITGLVFFYLGKQIPYWYAFPPWRRPIISNTFICVGITIASSYLPRIEYAMLGMTLGMLTYVFLTFKRILSVDVRQYLEVENH